MQVSQRAVECLQPDSLCILGTHCDLIHLKEERRAKKVELSPPKLKKKYSKKDTELLSAARQIPVSIFSSAAVIPAEQSELEPSDHPLNEGKGLGFSFSSDCRMTKTHIGSLVFLPLVGHTDTFVLNKNILFFGGKDDFIFRPWLRKKVAKAWKFPVILETDGK